MLKSIAADSRKGSRGEVAAACWWAEQIGRRGLRILRDAPVSLQRSPIRPPITVCPVARATGIATRPVPTATRRSPRCSLCQIDLGPWVPLVVAISESLVHGQDRMVRVSSSVLRLALGQRAGFHQSGDVRAWTGELQTAEDVPNLGPARHPLVGSAEELSSARIWVNASPVDFISFSPINLITARPNRLVGMTLNEACTLVPPTPSVSRKRVSYLAPASLASRVNEVKVPVTTKVTDLSTPPVYPRP